MTKHLHIYVLSVPGMAAMFSVRVVSTDHYMAAPVRGLDPCHSTFRQTDVGRVPVLRVFGATPAGKGMEGGYGDVRRQSIG